MYDTPDLILQKMDDDEFIPACVVPGADETLEKWLIVVSAQGDTGSEALSEWNDAVNTWTIPCLVVCLLGFVEYGIWYIFVCKHSQEKHLFSYILVLIFFSIVQTKFNALKDQLNSDYIEDTTGIANDCLVGDYTISYAIDDLESDAQYQRFEAMIKLNNAIIALSTLLIVLMIGTFIYMKCCMNKIVE